MIGWKRFRTCYFNPGPWERWRDGRLYELLGVRFFKKYLPTSGDLVSRARGIRRIGGAGRDRREDLERLERFTRVYEARHIAGALSMLAISWWAVAVHRKGDWAVLLAANLLINGYPIFLQRYNRVRLRRARLRLDWLSSSDPSGGLSPDFTGGTPAPRGSRS